ncbi:hypothetical protein QR685DRAFT_201904 [Neurospora intermedia]|uniref:Uncharacterized protein n=1 Tax=Neurospora intermedia TaxID=5142 RepID=A0ABR3DFI9_NEUIN
MMRTDGSSSVISAGNHTSDVETEDTKDGYGPRAPVCTISWYPRMPHRGRNCDHGHSCCPDLVCEFGLRGTTSSTYLPRHPMKYGRGTEVVTNSEHVTMSSPQVGSRSRLRQAMVNGVYLVVPAVLVLQTTSSVGQFWTFERSFLLTFDSHSWLRCSTISPQGSLISTSPSRPRPPQPGPSSPPQTRNDFEIKPTNQTHYTPASTTRTFLPAQSTLEYSFHVSCDYYCFFFLRLVSSEGYPPTISTYPSIPIFSSILAATSSSPHLVVSRYKQIPHPNTTVTRP